MSTVDLHPEDLLDKEMIGELSEEERARLEAHLVHCAACRFERLAREDFRAEFHAEAARVRGAQHTLLAPARPARRPLRVAMLLAAASLMISAVAGAAWVGVRHWSIVRSGADVPAPPASSVVPAVTTPTRWAHPPVNPDQPDGDVPDGSTSAPDLVPEQAPTASTTPRALRPPAVAEPVIAAPAPSAPAPEASGTSPSKESEAAEPPSPTAAEVFAAANAARARGDYAAAVALYQEVAARYPGSPEARTTQAILGRLLLDRGNAAGALRYFDAYLGSGGGALREESMVGRAHALRRLGRRSEEAAAWSSLLASFPGSSHAQVARARLEELSGP